MTDITEKPWQSRTRLAAPHVAFLPPPPAPVRDDQGQTSPPSRTRTAPAPWHGLVSPPEYTCPSCRTEATRDQHAALAVTHRTYCLTRTATA
ncbi:hypothetical protein [Frankia sp. EAN1pec]|uniref:hypothetical protein n=1 Tax=Parafrankia sp. (strain EAN1pec) TaxID=298653 RepID=UPI00059D739D